MKNTLYALLVLHLGVAIMYLGVDLALIAETVLTYISSSALFFSGVTICNFSRRVFNKGFDI